MITRGISTRTKGCTGKPSIPVLGLPRDGGQQIVLHTPTSPRGRDTAATIIEVGRQDALFMNGKRAVGHRLGPRNRRAGKAEIAEPGGKRGRAGAKARNDDAGLVQRMAVVYIVAARTAQSVPSIKIPENKLRRSAQQASRTMRVEP